MYNKAAVLCCIATVLILLAALALTYLESRKRRQKFNLVLLVIAGAAGMLSCFGIMDGSVRREITLYSELATTNSIVVHKTNTEEVVLSLTEQQMQGLDHPINLVDVAFLPVGAAYTLVAELNFMNGDERIRTISLVEFGHGTETASERRFYAVENRVYGFMDTSPWSKGYLYSFSEAFAQGILSDILSI